MLNKTNNKQILIQIGLLMTTLTANKNEYHTNFLCFLCVYFRYFKG